MFLSFAQYTGCVIRYFLLLIMTDFMGTTENGKEKDGFFR